MLQKKIMSLKESLLACKNKKVNKKGFTLIELIIVIAIIAILVILAMPNFQGVLGSSRTSSAESNIKVIGDATTTYYSEMGKYPDASSIEDLRTILTSTEEDFSGVQKGPWLKKNMNTKDPWGNEYRYEVGGDSGFDIISNGPDGDSSNQIKYSTLGNKKANNE